MTNDSSYHDGAELSATVKAEDIAPAARAWVASVLQIDLSEGDELTLALHRAREIEESTRRVNARQQLLALLAQIDEKTRPVPDAEMDAAIAEAMRFVRSVARRLMRVTCDTNVLVRAAVRPDGPARAVLLELLSAAHRLVLSGPLVDELSRVLRYERVRRQDGIRVLTEVELLTELRSARHRPH